ncbi:hypothetical protein HDU79_003270 [Rhizoclosmatium sp. JEL0117]|nr:hypothetical protein HDU79_003270 [Rhizoclosmatium sp. JEL0117]
MSQTLTFKVRAPSGETHTVQVDSESTFGGLKAALSPVVSIAATEMRVVCGGRILRDDDAAIQSLGLADGATLHVVRQAQNSQQTASSPAAAATQARSPAAANPLFGGMGGAGGMPDRDQMQAMMRNPMMQALLNNPDLMASIMEADPRMQAMAEQNPEIRRMLRDPAFLRQMTQAMQNPALMDEMQRNQDRALSNIESMPGGMTALSGLYSSMERTQRALEPTGPTVTDESNRLFAERIGADLSDQSALPNPWAPAATTSSTARPAAAGAATGTVPNPFAALSGAGAGAGANPFAFPQFPTPAAQAGVAQPGAPANSMQSDPFLSALLGMNLANQTANQGQGQTPSNQQPNPVEAQAQRLQMLTQLIQLQQAMQGAQAGVAPGAASQQPQLPFFNPYANPYAFTAPPAATTPVSPTPAAPAIPPEERFKDQLEQMNAMGFDDNQKNIKALLAAGGNLESAINYLLSM